MSLPRAFLALADLHQADADAQSQKDQLRQMVLREGLADAPRHQVQEELGDRFLGEAASPQCRARKAKHPRRDGSGSSSERPITIATRVLIR